MDKNELQKLFLIKALSKRRLIQILIPIVLLITSNIFSQTNRIYLPKEKLTIARIFNEIENQTEYKFFYRPDQIDINKEIKITSEINTVETIIDEVLAQSKLKYVIMEDNLIVIVQEDDRIIVHGKVISTEGIPLPGANIMIKGTTSGTITDLKGNFKLVIPTEEETLQISYVGFHTRELKLSGEKEVFVTLHPDLTKLDEIIIVGYGSRKKSLVIGAISKMTNKDIMLSTPVVAEKSLQGMVSGVNIMQNSGSPGSELTVHIRGVGSNYSSEPLYVIDGMRVNDISFIEPNDIESIELLKDAASAAIYGAEGANGVILITTKKGRKDMISVNYEYMYGVQHFRNRMRMMNAYEYATYKKEAVYYEIEQNLRRNADGEIDEDLIHSRQEAAFERTGIPDPEELTDREGTDWLGEIFQPAPVQKHYLSFGGGNEVNTYQVSTSYYNQDGIVGGDKTSFIRHTARINSNHKLNNWLSAGTKFYYSYLKRNQIYENHEYGGLIGNAIFIDPITSVYYQSIEDIDSVVYNAMVNDLYGGEERDVRNSTSLQDENGYFGVSNLVRNEIRNPVAQLYNSHSTRKQDRILVGLHLNTEPVKNLNIRTQFDLDVHYTKIHEWFPATLWNIDNITTDDYVSDLIDNDRSWQWENYATYSRKFRDHSVTVLGGITWREYISSDLGGVGYYLQYESDDFAHISRTLSDSLRRSSGMTYAPVRLKSYFGRLSYNYSEKYLIELVLRKDGSSLLPPGNRFGLFPSASVGWVLSREKFWKYEMINYLKLRFSWGLNGSLSNLTPFGHVSRMSNMAPGASGRDNFIYAIDANGNLVPAVQPAAISNADLGWEESEQIDLGFDIGIYQNSFVLSFDYFNKKTKDLLTQGGVPGYVGNYAPFGNSGSVENKGFEIETRYKKRMNDLGIEISANATYIKNKVTFFNSEGGELNGAGLAGTPSVSKFTPGYPVWYFSAYATDGIFQTWDEVNEYTGSQGPIQPDAIPGDFRIVDQNDDGVINEDDKVYAGSPWPDWTFGFTLYMEYKGIDFNLFINGSLGNEVNYGLHRKDINNANLPYYFYENRWTPDNPSNTVPRATYSSGDNFRALDVYIQDGSWVKLNTLTVGYTLPENIYSKMPIKKFRLYVSAANLYTFTKYRGLDPEIGNTDIPGQTTLTYNSIGIDRGFYPSPTTYIVGLSVMF
ncbi:MAG: TonB-dependent receptor [Bacteroidales bacterium]|nr:TonB-dependent receptor [Bacteroidales bacterium]